MERIGYCQTLFDLIRIDHFRAFDTFWKIPATCPTAVEGAWIEAPGYEVLDTLYAKLPGLQLVAEDLGDLRPQVLTLRDHYQLPGMKVLEFTLQPVGRYVRDLGEDRPQQIVYTGTHDNDTVQAWYASLSASYRRKLRKYLKTHGFQSGTMARRLILLGLRSRAALFVAPLQDVLSLGAAGRMNLPGTVGSPNWEWRLDSWPETAPPAESPPPGHPGPSEHRIVKSSSDGIRCRRIFSAPKAPQRSAFFPASLPLPRPYDGSVGSWLYARPEPASDSRRGWMVPFAVGARMAFRVQGSPPTAANVGRPAHMPPGPGCDDCRPGEPGGAAWAHIQCAPTAGNGSKRVCRGGLYIRPGKPAMSHCAPGQRRRAAWPTCRRDRGAMIAGLVNPAVRHGRIYNAPLRRENGQQTRL